MGKTRKESRHGLWHMLELFSEGWLSVSYSEPPYVELTGVDISLYTRVSSTCTLGKEMPFSKMGQLACNCCLKTNKSFKTIAF